MSKNEANKCNPDVCDICNKSCRIYFDDEIYSVESILLKGDWGYLSKRDMEYHEARICESCYDKILQFIKSIGGQVRRYQYFFNGATSSVPLDEK